MIIPTLLRDPVRKAQALLLNEMSEEEAFDCLFGLLVEKVARAAGWEDAPPGGFSGAGAPEAVRARFGHPDLEPLWQAEETLGWAYQFWNERDKREVFARLYRDKRKIRAEEIPAATQLFTPAWIARFLVENTLGRLWQQMHPDSAVAAGLGYLVPAASPLPRVEARPVSTIRFCDPACGTMNFGLAAYDLFAALYREEAERAGQLGWPRESSASSVEQIPAAILRQNLYGADIDARALRLAEAALSIRAGRGAGMRAAVPNLARGEAPRGSLLRLVGEARYDCVATNPPYMIQRSMGAELAAFLRESYPEARGDLYAAFILRSLEMLKPGGRAGLVTQQSFMFLPSYAALRGRLAGCAALETLLHTGTRAFPSVAGEKVNTAAFVLRREDSLERRGEQAAACFRLDGVKNREDKRRVFEAALAGKNLPGVSSMFRAAQAADLPGGAWVYWAPESILRVFATCANLDHLPGSDGNKTGDNARFIRDAVSLTAEEAASGRWRRLARPGSREPYRQDFLQVVDWSPEARDFYRRNPSSSKLPEELAGRGGICWNRVASRRFSARRFPAGVIPDVATPALYPAEADSAFLAALMNSKAGRYLLKIINPTINYALGDVRRLPVPPASEEQKQALTRLVEQIEASGEAPVAALEAEIDAIIAELYGFSEEEIALIEREMN